MAQPPIAVGIDVASVRRVTAALERRPALWERLFSEQERRNCRGRDDSVAVRFAAKEAVRKLAGSLGLSPLPGWREITIVRALTGAPHAVVAGWPGTVALSLSHEGDTAVAVAAAAGASGPISVPLAQVVLPDRPREGHKGSFGMVTVVAGSVSMPGAALLSAMGAARGGAGRVRLCVPRCIHMAVAGRHAELMVEPLAGDHRGLTEAATAQVLAAQAGADALVIGPGLGRSEATQRAVIGLLEQLTTPMVVDADALNAVAVSHFDWHRTHAPVVITPHPGEMAALLGTDTGSVVADPRAAATGYAQRMGITVLLKGSSSIVATADGQCWSGGAATPALATGGSGDVLGGLLAALLGQAMEPAAAARAAISIHAEAGHLVERERGRAGGVAGDIVEALPLAQERIRQWLQRRAAAG